MGGHLLSDQYKIERAARAFKGKYVKPRRSDCWLWIGPCKKKTEIRPHDLPYGKTYLKLRNATITTAHRLSWVISNGFVPASPLCVLHRCDNPRCVNPDHLFLGTVKDNNKDCHKKGRHPVGGPKKITREQINSLKTLRSNGLTWREIANRFNVQPSGIWTRYNNLLKSEMNKLQ